MGKLKETLKNLAKEYQTEIQRLIAQEELVGTGKLKKSIEYKMTEDGFEVSSDENYAYLLGSNGYLKRWRRPPHEKLAEWAKRKGMRPLMRDRRGRFKKASKDGFKRLGFALAKSIDRNGTVKRYGGRGSRIIQRVNQKLEGKVSGEIMEAYRLDLIQGMKQQFKFDNIKVE